MPAVPVQYPQRAVEGPSQTATDAVGGCRGFWFTPDRRSSQAKPSSDMRVVGSASHAERAPASCWHRERPTVLAAALVALLANVVGKDALPHVDNVSPLR